MITRLPRHIQADRRAAELGGSRKQREWPDTGKYNMYIVYCILFIVYCTFYIVYCILDIVDRILYIVYRILYVQVLEYGLKRDPCR